MRYTPIALAAAGLMLMASNASFGAPAEQSGPLSETSVALQRQAETLRASGDLEAAVGYYETALVADPRNVTALIGLGDLARQRELPGKAVTFYRDALTQAPDNRDALAGLGAAYVARGAVDRARTTLAQLQQLCGDTACPQVTTLTQALNTAGQRTAMRPDEVLPQPVVENAPTANN